MGIETKCQQQIPSSHENIVTVKYIVIERSSTPLIENGMCKKTRLVKEGEEEEEARITFYDGEGSTIQQSHHTLHLNNKIDE